MPSVESATQIILSRLMTGAWVLCTAHVTPSQHTTEDPLSLSDLAKSIPELSKDQLAAVLEVMQVL